MLGLDPDALQESWYARFVAASASTGVAAVQELAAAAPPQAMEIPHANALHEIAQASGQPCRFMHFDATALDAERAQPAWKLGAAAAKSLRAQHGLDMAPLTNQALSQICGLPAKALTAHRRAAARDPGFAFV